MAPASTGVRTVHLTVLQTENSPTRHLPCGLIINFFKYSKDHVVLLPEEYYTAKKLQPDGVQPCMAGQPKETICNDYKYISLKPFQSVQAESGTNSKGFGFEVVEKTQLFNDPDILQQLPVINDMAELSSKQVGCFLFLTLFIVLLLLLLCRFFEL